MAWGIFERFVGRSQELNTIQNCYDLASTGKGQIVTVAADAGMGKTRLFHEVKDRLKNLPCILWEAPCLPDGRRNTYLPFASIFRTFFRLHDADSETTYLSKIKETLSELDPALLPMLPSFLTLLGQKNDLHRLPPDLKGDKLNAAVVEAIAATIAAAAKEKPLVIVLEDWQWADPLSDNLLRHLVSLIPNQAVLIAVNFRLEYKIRWTKIDHHVAIVLNVLDKQALSDLMKKCWSVTEVPAAIVDLVYSISDGTPLFVEQICLYLRENGLITYQADTVSLSKPATKITIPRSTLQIVDSRVRSIDPAAREVLSAAAVIGYEFSITLLAQALTDRTDIQKSIDGLTSRYLIRPIKGRDGEYMFWHSMMQKVAYALLTPPTARILHGLVAAYIEKSCANSLDDQSAILAFHYQYSENTSKAVHYLEMAGDRAAFIFSVDIADSYFMGALQNIQKMEENKNTWHQYINIALKWSPFAHKMPSLEKIKLLQWAYAATEKLTDLPASSQVSYWIGMIHNYRGDHPSAQKFFNQAIEIGMKLNRSDLVILPANQMGRSCFFTGNFKNGLTFLDKGSQLARKEKNMPELAISLGYIGLLQAYLGEFKIANAAITEAQGIGKGLLNPIFAATLDMLEAIVYMRQSKWSQALEACQRASTTSRKIGLATVIVAGLAVEGHIIFMMGHKERGLRRMCEAFDLSKQTGTRMIVSTYQGLFAEMWALMGDHQRAKQVCQEALLFFDETKMVIGKGDVFRALALAGKGSGENPDKIFARIEESIRYAKEKHAQPEYAVTLFRKAQLELAQGASPVDNETLKAAEELFVTLDMPGWLNELQRTRAIAQELRAYSLNSKRAR